MGSRRSLSNRGFIWTSMEVTQVLICFFIGMYSDYFYWFGIFFQYFVLLSLFLIIFLKKCLTHLALKVTPISRLSVIIYKVMFSFDILYVQ